MKLSKSGKTAVANWHPDFRLVEKLPDIKVIRTKFLINAVAVTVLLIALASAVWVERDLADVQTSIGSTAEGGLLKEIAESRTRLAEVQKLQADFDATEKKVREIDTFVTPTVVGSEWLSQISRTFPRLIVINGIEYRGNAVKLRGTLVGASERATVLARKYVDQLARDPVFSSKVEKVHLPRLEREQSTGRLAFEIELLLKPRK